MEKETRIGVIGVGYLGRLHAQIYKKTPGVKLVGIHDINHDTSRHVAAEINCKAFTDLDDLLCKVDAVSIVTSTTTHAEVATLCIDKGLHILMEKPIADSYLLSEQIVKQADEAGIIFQVGFLERFNAAVIALAGQIQHPRFIESYRLSPFIERCTDIDVINDLMIHDIDLILSLVPSEINRIAASGMRVLTEHIDIANVRLDFANGAVANLTASRVSSKRYRQMKLFEKKHYYSLDFDKQQLEITGTKPFQERRDQLIMQKLNISPVAPLDTELTAFVNTIKTNTQPVVNGYAGLKAMKVAENIRNALTDITEES